MLPGSGYVVRKDIRNTTPSAVFEVFTELYQSLVEDVDALYNNKEMQKKLTNGEWDPIESLMSDARMKNAVGVFLQRKNMIVNRMTENEAYDKARETLPAALDDMKNFIGAFLSDIADLGVCNGKKRNERRKGHRRTKTPSSWP